MTWLCRIFGHLRCVLVIPHCRRCGAILLPVTAVSEYGPPKLPLRRFRVTCPFGTSSNILKLPGIPQIGDPYPGDVRRCRRLNVMPDHDMDGVYYVVAEY